jgi:hypothetical protein
MKEAKSMSSKLWFLFQQWHDESPEKIIQSIYSARKIVSFYFYFLFLVGSNWVHLVLRPLLTGLLYQPQMTDDCDCGAVGGMKIDRGNRSTRRKPAPVPLCPPSIPHDLTWARTRAAALLSQRLTAWALARPRIVFRRYRRLFSAVLVSCLLWKSCKKNTGRHFVM